MSVPFRERNPVIIGAVSLAVIAAFVLAAFKAEDLPLIGGGDTYYAAFSEAGGLKANDEVRIAGVRVGKVRDVTLEDGHVRVEFKVDRGVDFGSTTGAAIKVKTLLGAMYLGLERRHAKPRDQLRTERVANGLRDGERKVHAPCKRASPLVGALIGAGRKELMNRVVVGAVNLDAVEPGLSGQ